MTRAMVYAGLPLPDSSWTGTAAQMDADLGIKFFGSGWYDSSDVMRLIVPQNIEEDITSDSVYVAYSWLSDPREIMSLIMGLPDQTPVPVPPEIRAAWSNLRQSSEELRQWAEGVSVQDDEGAPLLERSESEEIEAVSPEDSQEQESSDDEEIEEEETDDSVRISLLPEQVPSFVPMDSVMKHRLTGREAFQFGPYIVQLVTAEERDRLMQNPIPPSSRLISHGSHGIAISLSA